MAVEFNGFFDSREGDVREYTEADMARFAQTLSRSGVRDRDALRISSANDGLRVNVSYGSAMVGGRYYALEDDGGAIKQITLSAPSSRPRVDRILLRMEAGTDEKRVMLTVAQGTEADSPIAPTLTRTNSVYEISLARVYLTPGMSLVTSEAITDERTDDELCGIIQGREDGAYELAAQAQATAETGVRNAAAAQGTADSAVVKASAAQEAADAAQATADVANEKVKGCLYFSHETNIETTTSSWVYVSSAGQFYQDFTVNAINTTDYIYAFSSQTGFNYPLIGAIIPSANKVRLIMANTPTIAGSVKCRVLKVREE